MTTRSIKYFRRRKEGRRLRRVIWGLLKANEIVDVMNRLNRAAAIAATTVRAACQAVHDYRANLN